MAELKYSFSIFDQFKIKLYSYYTYPKLSLLRIINGPILIIFGILIYFYSQNNAFFFYAGVVSIFFGVYYCLRPYILLFYNATKSSFSEESASIDKDAHQITFTSKNATTIIRLANIEKIDQLKWGYKLQMNFEKRKVFFILPYKNVNSGNLDDFIQEIKEN